MSLPVQSIPPIPWEYLDDRSYLDLSMSTYELEEQLKGLFLTISKLFNSPYKIRGSTLSPVEEVVEEVNFNLGLDSGQVLSLPKEEKEAKKVDAELLPEVIMREVILKESFAFLQKNRPMLSLTDMKRISFFTNEWYYGRVLLKVKKEGAEALFTPYDPVRFPEISYYILKANKYPRPLQLKVHSWINGGLMQGHHRHFQLPPGAGKTDVVAILLNLLAKRLKYMAVTCVTQGIYSIDKCNLNFNLRALNETLGYLEVGMHMINRITADDLEYIFSELNQYLMDGRALILVRNTYDALFLIREVAYRRALESKDHLKTEFINRIRWSSRILNFLKTKCLLICDESHQNADALTRAIYGFGSFNPIEEQESVHLLRLMKVLFDKSDVESFQTPEEFSSLRRELAREYLSCFPEIKEADFDSFIEYWIDSEKSQPELLIELGKSFDQEKRASASCMALTGYFLIHLLPDLLKLRINVDFGRALYNERKYDVPWHNSLPSTAEFDDPYRTIVLTIKGMYKRGLTSIDVKELLEMMIKSSNQEQRTGCTSINTKCNKLFLSWIGGSSLENVRLEDITLSDAVMMNTLFLILSKKREVIDYFMSMFTFKQIGVPDMQLNCSVTDIFNGFKSVVAYSATPRSMLAMPSIFKEEDYFFEPHFESKVRDKLREEQNQRKLFLEHPDRFFEEMANDHGEYFKSVTVFIDPRGFFSAYTNQQVAEKWMEANSLLDGVVYPKDDERSPLVDRSQKFLVLLKSKRVIELEGSGDVRELLKQHGLDFDALNLATYYDPSRSESSNILQKRKLEALLFVGEGLTLSHATQALMRLRGFVEEGFEQNVSMVFLKHTARQIFSTEAYEIDEFFHWTYQNQKEQEEKRIILNTYQEIAYLVAQEAREEIHAVYQEDESEDLSEALQVYAKYESAFVEPIPCNAYEAFAEHDSLCPVEDAFYSFAESLYARFNYAVSFRGNQRVQEGVLSLIQNVKQVIEKIHSNANKLVAKEVEQHIQRKCESQREQENYCPRPYEPLALPGIYGNVSITSPMFFPEGKWARDVFKSDFLNDRIYLELNHMKTARLNPGEEEGTRCIKPIRFYMILLRENNPAVALVMAHELVSSQLKLILDCQEVIEGLKHTVFIVSAKGDLIQRGVGALAPRGEVVEELIRSEWMQELIIDAALLKGEIPDHPLLHQRIERFGWPIFEELWLKILEGLPCLDQAETHNFETLRKRYAG